MSLFTLSKIGTTQQKDQTRAEEVTGHCLITMEETPLEGMITEAVTTSHCSF